MEYKTKRFFIIGVGVFLLVILYLLKNSSLFIRFIGFFFGLIVFYLVGHLFKIRFKIQHYIYIIIILLSGILLAPLYFFSENYDKVLHFLSPVFGSIIIFYMINSKRLNFQWKLLVTFMFVVSFLAIHEMGEYLIDLMWDLKLQGVYIRDVSGIEKFHLVMPKNDDTMIDMLFGTFGGFVFVIGKTINYYLSRGKISLKNYSINRA